MELMTSWEKKGIEQGLEKGKTEVVKKMLKKGFQDALILEVTGLTEEALEKIKQDMRCQRQSSFSGLSFFFY